jgi:hypothetical protein
VSGPNLVHGDHDTPLRSDGTTRFPLSACSKSLGIDRFGYTTQVIQSKSRARHDPCNQPALPASKRVKKMGICIRLTPVEVKMLFLFFCPQRNTTSRWARMSLLCHHISRRTKMRNQMTHKARAGRGCAISSSPRNVCFGKIYSLFLPRRVYSAKTTTSISFRPRSALEGFFNFSTRLLVQRSPFTLTQ